MLWSHIGILMRTSLQNLAGSQDFYCPLDVFVEDLVEHHKPFTLYSMVWYWRVFRAGQLPFYPKLLASFLSSTILPFSSYSQ